MREIHWAVLGTGVIANEMATATGKKWQKALRSRKQDLRKGCKVWRKIRDQKGVYGF